MADPRDDRRRTALTFHVEDFAGTRDELPFIGQVQAFQAALRRYGYQVDSLDAATEVELRNQIDAAVSAHRPRDVVLVHLVSHGVPDAGNKGLYLLFPDGRPQPDADLVEWIRRYCTESGAADRPNLLFVLDLCRAGVAADPRWWNVENENIRTFVWAASRAAENAFDARFTQAITTVLDELADASVAAMVAAGEKYLSWDLLQRRARTEVDRLSRISTQRPVGTPEHAYVNPPFFGNPHYSAQAPATGRDGLPTNDARDFYGREASMRKIAEWLHGGSETRSFLVVTGRAGVGKSALLDEVGRRLRRPGRELLPGYAFAGEVGVVSARGLDAGQLARSLGTCLKLTDSTPETLVRRVIGWNPPTLVVVDALDEAADPAGIVARILEPMVAVRTGDRRLGRVMVAARPGSAVLSRLTDAMVVDLDQSDRDSLRRDLFPYLSALLLRLEGAIDIKAASTFAQAAAERLVPMDGSTVTDWGEFLVATLHAGLELGRAEGPWSEDMARRRGQHIQLEVGQVVDTDVEDKGRELPWLRPVLTALSWARGQGMPVEIIRAAASYVAGTPDTLPTFGELSDTLAAAKYYLDRTVGAEAQLHYRLFHQTLEDHLRRDGQAAAVFDAIQHSVPVRPDGRPDWLAAAPYARQHILEHAAAVGRLTEILVDTDYLMAGPTEIGEALGSADRLAHTEDDQTALRAARRVHDAAGALLDRASPASRWALAMVAAHHGAPRLAARLADGDSTWRPRWGFGPRTTDAGPVAPEPFVGADFLLVLRTGGQLAGYDLTKDYRPCWDHVFRGDFSRAAMMAFPDNGVPRVVVADRSGGAWLWTPSTGEVRLPGPRVQIVSLARERSVLLGGDRDGSAWIWRLGDASIHPRRIRCGIAVRFLAVCQLDGRPTMMTPSPSGGITVRPIADPEDSWALDHGGEAVWSAVDVALPDGTPGLVTIATSGAVGVWDLRRRVRVAERQITLSSGVPVIARLDDARLVIGTGWSLCRLDVSDELEIEELDLGTLTGSMLAAARISGVDTAFVSDSRNRAVSAFELDDPGRAFALPSGAPVAALSTIVGARLAPPPPRTGGSRRGSVGGRYGGRRLRCGRGGYPPPGRSRPVAPRRRRPRRAHNDADRGTRAGEVADRRGATGSCRGG